MKPHVFLVHEWETTSGLHNLHVWDGECVNPKDTCFESWPAALEQAYLEAERLGLPFFQIDHPDFPHKFLKVMKEEDFRE